MKSGWWEQQEQSGRGKQERLYDKKKKKIHRTCQRTNRMWGTSEKEVATMILDVLSLGSRDMKRLNWNVLEEEVILGGGETST